MFSVHKKNNLRKLSIIPGKYMFSACYRIVMMKTYFYRTHPSDAVKFLYLYKVGTKLYLVFLMWNWP